MSTSNHPDPNDNRLNREVDEILKQASSRPISFQQRLAQKRNAANRQRPRTASILRAWSQRALAIALKVPVVTALALAILAAYIAPSSGVIATVLALAAVIMVFLPFAMRRPVSSSPPSATRWRGQIVSNSPPATSRSSSPLQHWFHKVRRRFN